MSEAKTTYKICKKGIPKGRSTSYAKNSFWDHLETGVPKGIVNFLALNLSYNERVMFYLTRHVNRNAMNQESMESFQP